MLYAENSSSEKKEEAAGDISTCPGFKSQRSAIQQKGEISV
jgi:hypothetical protein